MLIDLFYTVSEEQMDQITTLIYTAIDGMGMHFLISKDRGIFLKSWFTFCDMVITYIES